MELGGSFEQLPQVFASLRELVSEGGEHLMGFGRIVAIPFQLHNNNLLLSNTQLTQDDAVFCLIKMLVVHSGDNSVS
jgi:hypothetical protein